MYHNETHSLNKACAAISKYCKVRVIKYRSFKIFGYFLINKVGIDCVCNNMVYHEQRNMMKIIAI